MKHFTQRTKTLRLLALMCVLSLCVGAWGQSATATLSFTKACSGSGTDDKGNSWTVTSDAAESTFDSDRGIHYGTGSKTVSYLTITSGAFTKNISKIVVYASDANSSAKIDVTVGGITFGTQSSALTSSNTAYTFEPTTAQQSTNFTGAVVVKISRSSMKKALYCKSIEVTYEDGSTPSCSVSPTSIDFGTVTQGGTVDAKNVTVTLTNTTYAAATLSGDNADAFEITAGEELTETGIVTVQPKAATLATLGTYSASLDIDADGVEGTKSVTLSLIVKEPVAEATFNKFSGALVAGDYIICSGTTAMKNVISNNRIGYTTITATNDKITTSDNSIVWKIAKDGDYWTIYNEEEEVYAAFTSSDGKAVLLNEVTDYARWQTTGTYEFTNKGKISKFLRYNSGYGFASYATGTGVTLSLYKKNVAGEVSSPTFSPETETFFDGLDVTLSQADNKDIYYTLDGTTPSKSSTKYTAAIHISATTTITAIAYDGDNASTVVSKTYTLGKTYASLAALVAAGAPTSTGETVRVTLTNETITKISSDGIVLKSNEQEVKIFKYNVPESWVVNGTVSGTLICPWKLYGSTWELCPTSWDDLSYKAGTKTNPTITATYKTKMTTTDDDDVYTVETETDGAMTVTSSVTSVALAEWSGKTVTINPIAVGTTTIKISFSATDTYNAAEKEYTLTVTEPFDPSKANALVAKKDGKYYAAKNTLASGKKVFETDEVIVVNNKVINLDTPEEYGWIITYILETDSATVQNPAGQYLSLSSSGSDATLSDSKNRLYVKDGGFYVSSDESSRAFAYNYNSGNDRMASYKPSAYPIAKPMIFSDGYTRNVTEGNWGTICLPNAVEAADIYGAKFYSIAGKVMNGDNPTSLVLTEETGDLVAGRPYFFKATADTLIVAYTGAATKNPGDYNGLFGTFYGQDITVGYILSNNQLLEVNNTFTCGANRAYVGIASVPVYNPSSVKASIEIEIGGATGIESVGSSAIDTQSSTYSISGQKVDGSYKGIVIKNGKKYIIR